MSPAVGEASLDVMATLYGRMPPAARALNPIGLLRAMTTGDRHRGVPAGLRVRELCRRIRRRPLRSHSTMRRVTRRAGRPGSTLGGTGIGVSRRCQISPALLDHLRWLMSADAQVRFIPAHDGQPSRRRPGAIPTSTPAGGTSTRTRRHPGARVRAAAVRRVHRLPDRRVRDPAARPRRAYAAPSHPRPPADGLRPQPPGGRRTIGPSHARRDSLQHRRPDRHDHPQPAAEAQCGHPRHGRRDRRARRAVQPRRRVCGA